ncbi:MAG: DUF2586 family protein [Bacillota bacterium]
MITINVRDGALGLQRPTNSRLQAKVGTCSAGTVNQVVRLRDPGDITANFGTGPLANALADAFAAGARELLVVRSDSDVAGTIGAVTEVKTGTGDMTVDGAPLDTYQVQVKILSAGSLNAATFQYSLDGGDTWSAEYTVPADGIFVVTGTGLTLTFTAGLPAEDSFKAGDSYSFTTAAPSSTVTALGAALDALLAVADEFDLVHVVGPTTSSIWTALATRASGLADAGRYLHFVAETRGPTGAETAATWADAIVTEVSSFTDTRVSLVAGRAEIRDLLSQRVIERNIAGLYTGRVAAIAEQKSPAEVALGSLPQIQSLAPAGITDADLTDLAEAQLVVAKPILGLSGFYINEGWIKAPAGSDYQTVELRRIMDKACRLVRRAALQYDHAEGTPEGVAALEAQLTAPLENEMGGQITAGRVVIPEQDLIATQKLQAKIRITPIPIMREIELDIGFENPSQGV